MEKAIEEFVRQRICANRGTQNVVMKATLIGLAERNHILVTQTMKKDEIYQCLREHLPLDAILEVCNIGMKSLEVQQLLGITHAEVKRLEKSGFLRVTGRERFRSYGKYMYAPLYDVLQVYSLTPKVIRDELERLCKKRKHS